MTAQPPDAVEGFRPGVVTSGGDAPGMNAIVAGASSCAERLGGRAVGVQGGFAGLAARRAAPMAALDAQTYEQESGTWLGTSRWAALREPEGREQCRAAMRALGLDGLLVVGGNGSAQGARALVGDDIPIAFVPATIDRDIAGTDVTIGMDSAVAYAVGVVDQLRITGRSLPGRAFLLQTLGAPTGHLAGEVAGAAGVGVVLVPERAYDLDSVAREIRELAAAGPAVAIMSEAVGDAVRIAEALAERAGVRVHPTILGHAQRAAPPSLRDRVLGRAAGEAAVEALRHGRSSFIGLDADGRIRETPLRPEAGAAAGPAWKGS
jgi:6-phosphofructokinase 1